MKHFFLTLLISGTLAAGPVVAQTTPPAPVEFTERVPTENLSRAALHARALNWAQQKFEYKPQSGLQSDAATGMLRLTGTTKLKPVNNKGQDVECTAVFEFTFRATDQGYTYNVGSFRIYPNPKEPENSLLLTEYIAEISADKATERTKNDRRVTAQANAIANDVALSFRSFMNTMDAREDGHVGL